MKVDLTVLNKLAKALQDLIETNNKNLLDVTVPKTDLLVEFAKAAGIASAISFEAAALNKDIGKIVSHLSVSDSEVDSLNSLDFLSGLITPPTKKEDKN